MENPHRARLLRFYQRYKPEAAGNADGLLTEWAGREEQLFQALVQEYGPEPLADAPQPAVAGYPPVHQPALPGAPAAAPPAPPPAYPGLPSPPVVGYPGLPSPAAASPGPASTAGQPSYPGLPSTGMSSPAAGPPPLGGAAGAAAAPASGPPILAPDAVARCTLPPCPMHKDFQGKFPSEPAYAPVALRVVDAQTDRGHRVQRVFAVTPSFVMLADTKGTVKKYVRLNELDGIVVQPSKKEEMQVLLKTKRKPDLLFYCTPDKRNLDGSDVPAMVTALRQAHQEVVGSELPYTVKAEPGELRKEAELKKPQGYEKPEARLAKQRDRPRPPPPPVPPPAPSPPAALGTGLMMPGTMTLPAPQPMTPPPLLPPPKPPQAVAATQYSPPESLQQDGPAAGAISPGGAAMPPPPGSARIPPEEVPSQLWVVCPDKPEAEGKYVWEGREHGGLPVWEGPDGSRVYAEARGRWVIGTDEAMERNAGWVVCCGGHRCKAPTLCDAMGWSVYQGEGAGWERCDATHICGSAEQAEGHQLQALVRRQHGVIASLGDRSWELREENSRLLSALAAAPAEVEGIAALRAKLEQLEKAVTDDAMASAQLLSSRDSEHPFSPLEVAELRKMSYRQQGRLGDLSEHCAMIEHVNEGLVGMVAAVARGEDPGQLPPVVVHSSPARAVGAAAARGEGGAPSQGAGAQQEGGPEAPQPRGGRCDLLGWAGTQQEAQLLQGAEGGALRFTAKAHVTTANGQVLAPCAVAVTDAALFVCTVVDGRVHHREAAEGLRRVTRFKDRRYVCIEMPQTELYVHMLEAEDQLLQHLRQCAPHAEHADGDMDAHVTDAALRSLFGLDQQVVLTLRREIDQLKAEVERWQQVLHNDRARAQAGLDEERARAADDAAAERARYGASELSARLAAQLHVVELREQEWRRVADREEAASREALLSVLTQAATEEGARWGAWAQRVAHEERSQLVLACASTVEKAGRAAVEREEGAARTAYTESLCHRLAAARHLESVLEGEQARRRTIEAAYAAGVGELCRPHSAWVSHSLVSLLLEHSRLRDSHAAASQELEAARGQLGEAHRGLTEETNKVGALLRANKVLRAALDTCRFADICRVRLDSLQLREHAGRVVVLNDAEQGRHRIALSAAARMLAASAAQGANQHEALAQAVAAADADAEALVRGGPAARSDGAVRAVAANCRRAAVQLPRHQRAHRARWEAAQRVLASASKGISGAYRDYALFDDAYGAAHENAIRGGYPQLQGWMHVADSVRPGASWRRRFFTFDSGTLSYQSPAFSRAKVVLTVDSLVAVHTEPSGPSAPDGAEARERPGGRYGSFLWVAESAGGERQRFSCPTQQERRGWIKAMNAAITHFSQSTGRDARKVPRGAQHPPPVAAPSPRRHGGPSASPQLPAPPESDGPPSLSGAGRPGAHPPGVSPSPVPLQSAPWRSRSSPLAEALPPPSPLPPAPGEFSGIRRASSPVFAPGMRPSPAPQQRLPPAASFTPAASASPSAFNPSTHSADDVYVDTSAL